MNPEIGMNSKISYLFIIFPLVFIAACSSPKIESDLGIRGAPDWVNEGTQAVDNKNGRYIYGVASAPALGDEALQRSTADNRARAEVARVVSTYIDSTMSDYTASSGEDAAGMSIEQNINSITQTVLNGSKVKGRWRDENTENVWAFVEMDMKALDDAIATSTKLSQNFKGYYSKNSVANFGRFVKEAQ
jgi:hypothetical protein